MFYIKVGKIYKTHGLKGELKAGFNEAYLSQAQHVKTYFVEIKNDMVPYFVKSLKAQNDGSFYIYFEDVNNVDDAKRIVNKPIFVREEDISMFDEEDNFIIPFAIGFQMVTSRNKKLGTIIDIMDSGHQYLAKIIYDKKELLIPIIDEWLVDIDVQNKILKVRLPEGLLDL